MPLSDAFRGVKFRQRSLLGDLASAAGGIAKGSMEEKERRRKAALEAAAAELQKQESERAGKRLQLDTEKFGYDKEKDNRDFDYKKSSEDRTFGENQRKTDFDMADTTADNERADRELEETARNNTLDAETSRMNLHNQPKPQLRQTKDGFAWFYPDGRVSGVVGADGNAVQGVPTQGERGAASDIDLIQTNFDTLKSNMAKVGNKPPNIGIQMALDGTKVTGNGPISSLGRSLANMTVGKYGEGYQEVQNSVQAIVADVGRLKSGLVLNEHEAQRIIGLVTTVPGDGPDVVAQKLQQIQSILDSAKIRAGRAMAPQGTATPAKSPQAATSAQQDWDALAAKHGVDVTTQRIGPRPQ